jgi:hypothetical protein
VTSKRVLTRPRGWVLIAAVALTALTAPAWALLSAGPADAVVGPFTMDITPQSATALTFLVSNTDATCTSQLTLTITAGATPITPTSTVNQDANNVLVTLPAGTSSPVTVVGNCVDVDVPRQQTAQVFFATVNVTKQVQGPDPASTTFTVHFDCKFTPDGAGSSAQGFLGSSASVHSSTLADSIGDLQYGSTGGTSPFYDFVGPATCTLTETNTGGAQSTSITPNPVDVVDPIVYSATVTNTFPPPAAALVVAPKFTG